MLSALALAAALVALGGVAYAQDAPTTGDEVTVTEEEIVVTGEQIDTYDVLPDRPTDSVFGTERTLAETPRSVTLIESPLIDLYGIRTVNDFVNMTAGTFTGNYFGVAGALDVRGERADNFFRGFRRIENRGNFPTSVAASDYVEVIKGPPPVVYGGGKVGGVLNFVPKSAKSKDAQYIGHVVGGASITLGTYGKRLGTAEFGTPFSIGDMASGVHIFAQVEDSDHFYHDIYTKNRLVQVAGNTEVGGGLSLEYGGMYQNADLNQSLGWNRVTQELIDTEGGRYLSGRPALNLDTNGDGQLSPSEVGPYQLEQFAFANPFPYGALSPMQQAAYALDPASVHYVSIDHRTVQVEKSDFSRSEVITGYLDLIYTPSDVFTIKNQTFYDDIDHLKFSSYGFTAAYDQWVFENKTTMNLKLQPVSALKLEVVGGASWRKSVGLERESRGRGFQVLDRRDISVGATANDRFEGAHSGTGNVPYNWQEDGQHTDLGVFGVIDATIAERVTLILGGRTDYYKVSVTGTDVFGVYGSAAASDTAFSYNGSLSVEPVDDIHLYTTYA
jgi:iron complex outermembrane receptor protein